MMPCRFSTTVPARAPIWLTDCTKAWGVLQRAGQRTAQRQQSAHACQHAVARLGFERQRKKHRRRTLHRANHQKALLQAQAVQQNVARDQRPQRGPGHIRGIDQCKALALLAKT